MEKLAHHPLFEALGSKELSELVDAMQVSSALPSFLKIQHGGLTTNHSDNYAVCNGSSESAVDVQRRCDE